MNDGEFKIGPSTKKELKADLKDMLIQLWWVWLMLVPVGLLGLAILWKFRFVFLAR